MIKIIFVILLSLYLCPARAALYYRSGTEILDENTRSLDFQYQRFQKSSAFDEQGTVLEKAAGESFSVTDFTTRYSKGWYPNLETSLSLNLRSVSSETALSSAAKSGLESLGASGKYLFLKYRRFQNAVGVFFKKAMFTNTLYSLSNPPPADEVALGDDGLAYGLNYYLTYFDKRFRYDFQMGYHKPSATLSSEIPYNFEVIYVPKNLFLLAGFGGIHSLKNDAYTGNVIDKPIVATGNSRLFNSINREKNYLYIGAQYAYGPFIAGIKGETIVSGKSTDNGSTISLNLRWEKVDQIAAKEKKKEDKSLLIPKEYFADGFVEKISKSGNLIKINIGTTHKLNRGDKVDIFNINNFARGEPIASGIIFEISENWSIVKINKRFNQSPIKEADLVRVY